VGGRDTNAKWITAAPPPLAVRGQTEDRACASDDERLTVYVQCTLDSGRVPSVSTKCQPEGRLSEDLVARIERLPAPTVRRKIAFQLVLDLGSVA
jgi:hypothetical protein